MAITPKNQQAKDQSGDKKAPLVVETAKTSKKAPKPKSTANKDFPKPKKGQVFMCNGHEGKVLDVNKPTAGFCTVQLNGKTDVIGLFALWEQIDQKKGYYKPTRAKHDWQALKAQFLASDFLEVRPFLRQQIGNDEAMSGGALKASTGWAEEKKKIQEEMKLEALKQFKSNIKKQWDGVFEKLEMAHVKGLEDLANMILDQGKVVSRKSIQTMKDPETGETIGNEIIDIEWLMPYLHHGDITSIIKHIKLEKGEPTDILDTNGKSLARAWLDDLKNQKGKKTETPKAGV